MKQDLSQLTLDKFVVFQVTWERGTQDNHVVLREDLDKIFAAFLELHHSPGVNPHVKDRDGSTARIIQLCACEMQPAGPFWWTTPGLCASKENSDAEGVRLWGRGYELVRRWILDDDGVGIYSTGGPGL